MFVQGDIFLTRVQAIALGLNAAGRADVSPLFTALADRYPVFVSDYRKQCQSERLSPGDVWVWRDSRPWLVGMIVRDTPQGATRLRYVETALLKLVHNGEREGLQSLAILLPGDEAERPAVRELLMRYLHLLRLPVVVYESYEPGVAAEESSAGPPSL